MSACCTRLTVWECTVYRQRRGGSGCRNSRRRPWSWKPLHPSLRSVSSLARRRSEGVPRRRIEEPRLFRIADLGVPREFGELPAQSRNGESRGFIIYLVGGEPPRFVPRPSLVCACVGDRIAPARRRYLAPAARDRSPRCSEPTEAWKSARTVSKLASMLAHVVQVRRRSSDRGAAARPGGDREGVVQ